MEKVPRLAISVTLPSGRKAVLKEPTAADDLQIATDAADSGARAGVIVQWSAIMRSLVSVDGEPFDRKGVTPETIKDYFSSKDFLALQRTYSEFFSLTPEEEAALRDSKSVSTAS